MEEESIYKILDKFHAEEEAAERQRLAKTQTAKTHKISLLRDQTLTPSDKPSVIKEHELLLSRQNLVSSFSVPRRDHATFGRPEGQYKPQPLIRRQDKSMTHPIPDSTTLMSPSMPKVHTKPLLPSINDVPIQGLCANVDYVRQNQFWACSIKPPTVPSPMNYLKKTDFGKVPDYLDQIKSTIDKENQFLQSLKEQRTFKAESTFELPTSEIAKMREKLQEKHRELNQAYQGLTHVNKVNTIGFRRRKETLERALETVEKDLACLQKDKILVMKGA